MASNQSTENLDRVNDGANTQKILMKKSMSPSIDQLVVVPEKPLHSSSKKRSMSRNERSLKHNTIQYLQTNNYESERNFDKGKPIERNKFKNKRNTMMLPSNFQRTKQHLKTEMSHMGFDDSKSQTTAGPADYNIERVIGMKKIV